MAEQPCPNCFMEFDRDEHATCPYCDASVAGGEGDQDEDYRRAYTGG